MVSMRILNKSENMERISNLKFLTAIMDNVYRAYREPMKLLTQILQTYKTPCIRVYCSNKTSLYCETESAVCIRRKINITLSQFGLAAHFIIRTKLPLSLFWYKRHAKFLIVHFFVFFKFRSFYLLASIHYHQVGFHGLVHVVLTKARPNTVHIKRMFANTD